MAVADLEIVGRRRVGIHLCLRSWDLLVVAELLIVGGVGAGNSAMWRSWDLLAGAAMGFFWRGRWRRDLLAGVRGRVTDRHRGGICLWLPRWYSLAGTEQGLFCRCGDGIC